MTGRTEETTRAGTGVEPERVERDRLEPAPVSVRSKISALWTATLFVFAYVDLFSLYRADVRAEIDAGEVGGFAVDQTFLLATTIYIVIPSVMLFGTLVLSPRISRVANIALASIYGVTIAAGAIGEWNYYVFGSVLEVALLAGVTYYAWTWPKLGPGPRTSA